MTEQLQHGLHLGIHWTTLAIGITAGATIVLLPIAIGLAAARAAWTGPMAKAGWRVRAWRMARRLRRRSRHG